MRKDHVKLVIILVCCIGIFVCTFGLVLAEEITNGIDIDAQYPAPQESPAQEIFSEADKYTFEFNQLKEQNRLYHTLGVAIAGMISLMIMLFVISKSKDYTAQDVIYASGLVFVIFGTIAIVVLADVEQQLTASIGIMGAIAGYLFGKMGDRSADGKNPTEPKNRE
ncbi:MAG: hypothetical protein NPIRA01_14300 [Nitrospirales bacterium]|nr:MAG: hypothetical protein NPIRA01_14300 [Nitrospirales bacterium]